MRFDPSIKYGILGMARSGISAAYKIKELGGSAFLSELLWKDKIPMAAQLMKDFECEFGGHTDRLLACDTWIVSPGIPLSIPIIQKGRTKGIKLISEIEFGWQIKAPDSKVIAVTGSNGKSTTASLIHHILTSLGTKSLLAGNIGDAMCGFPIHQPGYDYIVLEISSFQLDLISSFAPDIAVLLNITPDHMNRYASFADYAASKMQIFAYQTAQDHAILCLDSAESMHRSALVKSQLHYFTLSESCQNAEACMQDIFLNLGQHQLSMYDVPIKGPHNRLNTLAALLVPFILKLDMDAAVNAVKTFKSLPHRLEYVDCIQGVSFYNDSKATNTDSVRSALESFERPIRIILGGSNKGEDFTVLTEALQEHAIKAYITGETMDLMRQAWLGKVPLVCISDFEECVRTAFEEATTGESVVLSPACASFDHFQNFEHRGETFKNIVREIKREKE